MKRARASDTNKTVFLNTQKNAQQPECTEYGPFGDGGWRHLARGGAAMPRLSDSIAARPRIRGRAAIESLSRGMAAPPRARCLQPPSPKGPYSVHSGCCAFFWVLRNTVLFVSLARARFIRVGRPEILLPFHPWLRQQFPVLVRYPRPTSVRASSRCPAFDQGPPPARD